LVLVSVAALVVLFDSVDQRQPVLQAVRDIPAGEQLTPNDLRVVEVGGDASLALLPAEQLEAVVGSYAKVRIVAGGLVAATMLQGQPLVSPGASLVAVSVPPGELPRGLRERSQVLLVMPPASTDPLADVARIEPVQARVVGLPTEPDQLSGNVSVTVEVSSADAVTVAAAPAVRVVLVEPGVDAA
jgi:hypothetical protein